jgi:hypothetical protein
MFDFKNLDESTRASMMQAIKEANSSGNIYFSTRFNQDGNDQWISLLTQAAQGFNEHWLAYQIEKNKLMKDFEDSTTPSGGYTIKHVPHTAATTFAEGQFNRFYILGLCKFAKSRGVLHLTVYRAKASLDPRATSEALIGQIYSIEDIESQLKETRASFKSELVKPNSGISVKIPES